MGLENQLSDVSTESIIILTVVLMGKTVRYLRSLLSTILSVIGVFSHSDVVAGVVLLWEDGGENSGSDCVVCLERFAGGDTVRKLACRHVFHKDCLDGWLGHLNFNCPLCRAPLLSTRRRVAWFPFQ